jgi:hypothetical protein
LSYSSHRASPVVEAPLKRLYCAGSDVGSVVRAAHRSGDSDLRYARPQCRFCALHLNPPD